jgi:hypothetical protein
MRTFTYYLFIYHINSYFQIQKINRKMGQCCSRKQKVQKLTTEHEQQKQGLTKENEQQQKQDIKVY